MEQGMGVPALKVAMVPEANPGAHFRLDLNSAVNRYGPPEAVLRALHSIGAAELRLPPATAGSRLEEIYGAVLDVPRQQLLAAAGTQQLIRALAAGAPHGGVAVPLPAPNYMLRAFGGKAFVGSGGVRGSVTQVDEALESSELVLVSNPNRLTGTAAARDALVETASRHPASTLVVDESFVDFLAAPSAHSLVGCDVDNVVVLRSPGAFYGIPSTRTAIAWSADPGLLRTLFGGLRTPAISGVDLVLAEAALFASGWASQVRRQLADDSAWLGRAMAALSTHPAGAGVRVPFRFVATPDAGQLADALAERGLIVRRIASTESRSASAIRITAPKPDERPLLAAAVDALIDRLPPLSAAG